MHCYISATCKKDKKQGCSTLEWYRANDHGWLWHWIESNWNPWHGSVHGWSVWNDRKVGFSQHSPPLSQIHQFSLSTHVPVQTQVQAYIYCMQDARFRKSGLNIFLFIVAWVSFLLNLCISCWLNAEIFVTSLWVIKIRTPRSGSERGSDTGDCERLNKSLDRLLQMEDPHTMQYHGILFSTLPFGI